MLTYVWMQRKGRRRRGGGWDGEGGREAAVGLYKHRRMISGLKCAVYVVLKQIFPLLHEHFWRIRIRASQTVWKMVIRGNWCLARTKKFEEKYYIQCFWGFWRNIIKKKLFWVTSVTWRISKTKVKITEKGRKKYVFRKRHIGSVESDKFSPWEEGRWVKEEGENPLLQF